MKATTLFRITAVLFVLFALGHTFGFLSFKPPTQEGLAVRDAMERVHFAVGGRNYSYGDWYRGFGLNISVAMLFQAFLAWYLGTMAKNSSPGAKTIGWAFFAWQIPGLVMAWLYFGLPPLILSALVAASIGAATWLAQSPQPMNASGNGGSDPCTAGEATLRP